MRTILRPLLGPALLCTILLRPLCAAAPPASQPTTAPARPVTLASGLVQYQPAAEPWHFVRTVDNGRSAVYVWQEPNAVMAISFVPGKAPPSERSKQLMIAGILEQIRGNRARSKAEVLAAPALLKDDRFFAAIHEKFRNEGATANQWHFYRNLPPHQIVVTVITRASADEQIQQAKSAAEAMSLSAELAKKQPKAP